jgi:hypothetical protein
MSPRLVRRLYIGRPSRNRSAVAGPEGETSRFREGLCEALAHGVAVVEGRIFHWRRGLGKVQPVTVGSRAAKVR